MVFVFTSQDDIKNLCLW